MSQAHYTHLPLRLQQSTKCSRVSEIPSKTVARNLSSLVSPSVSYSSNPVTPVPRAKRRYVQYTKRHAAIIVVLASNGGQDDIVTREICSAVFSGFLEVSWSWLDVFAYTDVVLHTKRAGSGLRVRDGRSGTVLLMRRDISGVLY
jgi:hypothetical protein